MKFNIENIIQIVNNCSTLTIQERYRISKLLEVGKNSISNLEFNLLVSEINKMSYSAIAKDIELIINSINSNLI